MSKTVYVPSVSLANLVYRAVRAGRLPYNYCCAWRELRPGWIAIHLANADWVAPGRSYVNPHTR